MKQFIVLATLALINLSVSANDRFEANTFVCSGKDVQMRYSTTSKRGTPSLSIEGVGLFGEKVNKHVDGEDISVEESSMGQYVGSELNFVPDLGSAQIRILLPSVNLSTVAPKASFQTIAVVTRHHTSIGGTQLLTGPLSDSKTVVVDCQATDERY